MTSYIYTFYIYAYYCENNHEKEDTVNLCKVEKNKLQVWFLIYPRLSYYETISEFENPRRTFKWLCLIVSQSLLTQRGQAPSTRSSLVVQYHSISDVQWVRRSVIINGAIVAARSEKRGRSGSGRAMNIFLHDPTPNLTPFSFNRFYRAVNYFARISHRFTSWTPATDYLVS